MKAMNKFLSFRNKIVLVVVALATIPLILFGYYALQVADISERTADRIKNTLMVNLSRETEDYFKRFNRIIAFTRVFEKRRISDDIQINRILLDALYGNDEILAVGYIRNNRITAFIGEDIKKPPLDERVTVLLKKYENDKWIQLFGSYKFENKYVFDMLYPLETGDFVFLTFSLGEVEKKLRANSIDDTGRFALIKGNGDFFAGDDMLKHRLQFLEIDELIKEESGKILITEKRGYQVKGKKLEGILWPFWVIFTQKNYEARALTRQLKYTMLAIFIGLLFISGTTSFTLAKNFSRPISSLLTAVKKNFKGDLESQAVIDKKDSAELALLITEFNRMIVNLKETRDELVEKEKLAAIGEMANVVSHDIRNPLAAIKNGAYFMRYAAKSDNPRVEKTLDIIDREIDSITKIINDLLGYSRQRPPVLSPVDVNSLMDEVISIIELPDNVTIKKEFAEHLSKFNLDMGEIRQVLVNLVNNAVQACDKDSGIVRVITGLQENGDLKMIIKDNGMGIPQDKIDKIFQAFYSTKRGGTGLGLASAKRIVERHNGTISIKSKDKVGTEVIISIPSNLL